MLYVIGVSFQTEMFVKALYENTFGRLFEWIGGHQSANDRYNAEAWQSYGAFMHQTPWYAYPFGQTLGGLWGTNSSGAAIRNWERRLALSLEYGAKAGYGGLIGWASGATLGRDELTLRLVVRAEPARHRRRRSALPPGGAAGRRLSSRSKRRATKSSPS